MAEEVLTAEAIFQSLPQEREFKVEPRKSFIKVGCQTSSKGSAYVEYGDTKVIASVDAPKEMTTITRKLNNNNQLCAVNCTLRFSTFAAPDDETLAQRESSMSTFMKNALEPMICRHEYPNFQIDIEVNVLDDNGCAISTAIVCASLALVDAGISTFDVVTATTVAFYKGVTYINPDHNVEKLINYAQKSANIEEYGIVTLAGMESIQQESACYYLGYMQPNTLISLVNYASDVNKAFIETVRHVLVQKVEEYCAEHAASEMDYPELIRKKKLAAQNKAKTIKPAPIQNVT